MPPTYTTPQAAEALGVSLKTIQKWRARLNLGRRVGRDWILSAADLRRIERRKTTPGPEPKKT